MHYLLEWKPMALFGWYFGLISLVNDAKHSPTTKDIAGRKYVSHASVSINSNNRHLCL